MSLVQTVVPRITLLDTLTALHGALGATTVKGVTESHILSCKERAELYHQRYQTLHGNLKTVEQALVKPQSNGSPSTT